VRFDLWLLAVLAAWGVATIVFVIAALESVLAN
jgi:hypothetical protein